MGEGGRRRAVNEALLILVKRDSPPTQARPVLRPIPVCEMASGVILITDRRQAANHVRSAFGLAREGLVDGPLLEAIRRGRRSRPHACSQQAE